MTPHEPSGRDRIITAALSLFAERGPDAVSMRDVAARAQVSPPLIPHHFGTKAGLKAAVDEHVARVFQGLTADVLADAPAIAGGGQPAAGFAELLLAHVQPGSPVPAYLRRLLLSGDPVGRRLFREWFEFSLRLMHDLEAAGAVHPARDPQVRATFMMVNDLAMILLHDHVADVIGVDPLTHDGLARWSADVLDAYTTGVFIKEAP